MAIEKLRPAGEVAPRRKYSFLGGNMNRKARLFFYFGLFLMMLASIFISPLMFITALGIYQFKKYFLWSKRGVIFTLIIALVILFMSPVLVAHAIGTSLAAFGQPHFFTTWLNSMFTNIWAHLALAVGVGVPYGLLWALWDWSRTPEHRLPHKRRTPWQDITNELAIRQIENGTYRHKGEIVFGVDNDPNAIGGAIVKTFRSIQNMMIFGITGSGKTQTLMKVVDASVNDGKPTFVLDMKGNADFYAMCKAIAEKAGAIFYHFSFSGQWHYDMFRQSSGANMSEEERIETATSQAELLISAETWSDEHYKSLAQDYAQILFQVIAVTGTLIRNNGAHTSVLESCALLIEPGRLRNHVSAYLSDVRYADLKAQALNWAEQVEKDPRIISGLKSKLNNIINTSVAKWLAPGENMFTLRQAYEENALVLFSLNQSKHSVLSETVGAYIVHDLSMLTGELQNNADNKEATFIADEFTHAGALPTFADAVMLVRSANFKVILSTQGIMNISTDGEHVNEVILSQLWGQSTSLIVHGSDILTAERFSKECGMKWGISTSRDTHEQNSALDIDRGSNADRGRVDDKKIPRVDVELLTDQDVGHFYMLTIDRKEIRHWLTRRKRLKSTRILFSQCWTIPDKELLAIAKDAGKDSISNATHSDVNVDSAQLDSKAGQVDGMIINDVPAALASPAQGYNPDKVAPVVDADSERTVPLSQVPVVGEGTPFLGSRSGSGSTAAPTPAPVGGLPAPAHTRAEPEDAPTPVADDDDGFWD